MLRFILALCLLSLVKVCFAQCQAVGAQDKVPAIIYQDQCFELTGGNVLSGNYIIEGKLFVKANSEIKVEKNSSILIRNFGSFEARGAVNLGNDSKIVASDESSLTVRSQFNLYDNSQIFMYDKARVRLAGHVFLNSGSEIRKEQGAEFTVSSILDVSDSKINIQDGEFVNQGTIRLTANSEFNAFLESKLINEGSFSIDETSKLTLEKMAIFENKRRFDIFGSLALKDNAQYLNYGRIWIRDSGFIFTCHNSGLLNKRLVQVDGQILMAGDSKQLNEGTLSVNEKGKVRLIERAYFISNATLHNKGSIDTQDEAIFKNQGGIQSRKNRFDDFAI